MKPNETPGIKKQQETEVDHLVQQLQQSSGPNFSASSDMSGFGAEEKFPPSSDRSGGLGGE